MIGVNIDERHGNKELNDREMICKPMNSVKCHTYGANLLRLPFSYCTLVVTKVCEYASMRVCEYASMQVCIFSVCNFF